MIHPLKITKTYSHLPPILILGATGDIGTKTLQILESLHIPVLGISFYSNEKKAISIAKKINVKHLFALGKPLSHLKELPSQTKIYEGEKELLSFIKDYNDGDFTVLNAIAGPPGLKATLATLKRGKRLFIANKESLVLGGHFIREELHFENQLIPLDSEHFSLFFLRSLIANQYIEKYYITASGGPFLSKPLKEFEKISIDEALKHPIWNEMGKNITISSSTLANKGLEVLEAKELFNIPLDKIDVLVHPQAKVHAAIQLCNGSFLSHEYEPSMQFPITQALLFPELTFNSSFNTPQKQTYEYFPVDFKKFPLLKIAYKAGEAHYSQILYTLSNHFANDIFLSKKLKYLDISRFIEYILSSSPYQKLDSITDVFTYINETHQHLKQKLKEFCS
jgi:1-deoxy-D-xylulose-5-phosphate reductoisomerase